jgi:hypothetical protein
LNYFSLLNKDQDSSSSTSDLQKWLSNLILCAKLAISSSPPEDASLNLTLAAQNLAKVTKNLVEIASFANVIIYIFI